MILAARGSHSSNILDCELIKFHAWLKIKEPSGKKGSDVNSVLELAK